jgi:TetR/AcrR family transcriptional regulator
VVAALAADEAGARRLAPQALPAVGDLQRGVDRLRARVGEKHPRQPLGRHVGDALGEPERHRVRELERGGVVERARLLRQRFDDLRVAVAERAAPQARQSVEQAPAVCGDEVGALGAGQQLGVLAEVAVGSEGQPAGSDAGGDVGGRGQALGFVHRGPGVSGCTDCAQLRRGRGVMHRFYSLVKFYQVVSWKASKFFASRPRQSMPMTTKAARKPRAARVRKEQDILREAERQFAQYGFEGASLENIGAAVGISRHNLLYYFPSKEALYRRVLDDVLVQWLTGMGAIPASDDPEGVLRDYIAAKMRFSRERPSGSQVFTKEVIAGAPRYADAIVEQVKPPLLADVKTFERWTRQGRIARLDFTHLMFVIWSVTQAYADLAPQFALLLGKAQLDEKDYAAAERLITHLVLSGLKTLPAAARRPPRG